MTNAWKITIPVERSEERSDGRYIIGQASGPERDGHGSRMSPEAIVGFARQIAERVEAGDPIPYIDQHAKTGVLRELGQVMEGTVGEDFRLTVGVRLDTDNPASNFLYNNLKRGKQYGMSVAGDGTDFVIDRDDLGSRVVTFTKVLLREISNTTRPSWVPSFGTVLARSLDQLDTTESESMSETTVAETTPIAETPVVEAPVVENSAPEVDADTINVERARIAAKDNAAVAQAFATFAQTLTELGIDLAPETPSTVTPETPAAPAVVENSETGDETVDFNGVKVERELAAALSSFIASEIERSVAPLTAKVDEQAKYIDALEKLPAGKTPAPIVREKFETETTGPDLEKMTPAERLRFGLSALYGND